MKKVEIVDSNINYYEDDKNIRKALDRIEEYLNKKQGKFLITVEQICEYEE